MTGPPWQEPSSGAVISSWSASTVRSTTQVASLPEASRARNVTGVVAPAGKVAGATTSIVGLASQTSVALACATQAATSGVSSVTGVPECAETRSGVGQLSVGD